MMAMLKVAEKTFSKVKPDSEVYKESIKHTGNFTTEAVS